MKIDSESLELLGLTLAAAFLAAVGRELGHEEPQKIRQIIGHTISNTVLGLVSGGLTLFFTDPHPLALIAVAAAIGTLGTDTASVLLRNYLERRAK